MVVVKRIVVIAVGFWVILCCFERCQAQGGGTNKTMSRNLGEDCVEDAQCNGTKPASSCRGNKCLACNETTTDQYGNCTDKHGCALHEVNNKCWKHREVGENCTSNEECWIYSTANHTRLCEKNLCVCNLAANFSYYSGPQVGVDKCMLPKSAPKVDVDVAAPAPDEQQASAGNAISSSEWSILVTLLVITRIALQKR